MAKTIPRKTTKKPAKAVARGVPKALPREPLTVKAEKGILEYVRLRLGANFYLHRAVEFTLKAERMKRVALYEWLKNKGKRWNSVYKMWI